MLNQTDLTTHINGCKRNDRASQKKIYVAFQSFAMSLCMKYVNSKDDALEIVNDGFLKIFKELVRYEATSENTTASFIAWLKRIMINTAIDRFRKDKKLELIDELSDSYDNVEYTSETALQKLSYEEIIKAIKTLPPSYYLVFSLYVIEGYTHKEIAKQLNIVEGTSKSNLAKARIFLQNKLSSQLT